MLNPSIQGTDKQDKSQLIQRSDTLIIFPYIKSTNNYPTMWGGLKDALE
tara:strand:+ start:630 stop:776 length:147 start_codon:yes stop_codon:yes gene_type:complete